MLGCIPPNTVITYDPAKPGDDDPVMDTFTFGGRVYVFHRNSTWVSVHLPWYKRLWWQKNVLHFHYCRIRNRVCNLLGYKQGQVAFRNGLPVGIREGFRIRRSGVVSGTPKVLGAGGEKE